MPWTIARIWSWLDDRPNDDVPDYDTHEADCLFRGDVQLSGWGDRLSFVAWSMVGYGQSEVTIEWRYCDETGNWGMPERDLYSSPAPSSVPNHALPETTVINWLVERMLERVNQYWDEVEAAEREDDEDTDNG
jgi:hypothetical protein